MIKAIGSHINLINSEYYSYVEDLINDEVVLQMKNYIQHGTTTCFQHCVNVSYYNYLLCKFFRLNCRDAARAGLLHDLFFYNRREYIRKAGEAFHNSRHPKMALENASRIFDINPIERDIILKHMWPCTLALPKYKETVAIIIADKYCAVMEFLLCRMKRFR
ncbi:MAG TPA: HAD family hydrolase [Ruminococcus sp.]|nr:HAD family hydrolase [Ruminococcus sp.]